MEKLSPTGTETDMRAWIARGADATQHGEFGAALAAYETARELATEPAEVDNADLNIAMVRLQMGDAKGGEEGLREILLRASNAHVAFHAAYNLASSLRKQGRYERALKYARRATECAQAIGCPDLLAPVHNLLGNLHLNQNYLDEALVEYETALALRRAQAGDSRFSRAILEENIGYCLILQKRFPQALARLRDALKLASETGDRRCRAECLQDLCYGYLMSGRLDEAIVEGQRALDEALRGGFSDLEENCRYLLGELGTRTGRTALRDENFQALQTMHPEVPFLREFLCTVDVTEFITLKR
ncbi:MAG TPA: tetratricopeptide repeat protein [Candidatus Polarisedimenticolaceae bacterium]|nr:tetratricopeptide repeat protein [Candidatus Polarisedimenticolaceae bacterium]